MSEQLIISVSREYGSGGHEIAQKLAEYYKLPMYDHNLLDEVAASMNVSSQELAEFDETRRNKFLPQCNGNEQLSGRQCGQNAVRLY